MGQHSVVQSQNSVSSLVVAQHAQVALAIFWKTYTAQQTEDAHPIMLDKGGGVASVPFKL